MDLPFDDDEQNVGDDAGGDFVALTQGSNHPLVDRAYSTLGLYQNENLVGWVNKCGNQGAQRLQTAPDRNSFTSGIIISARTKPGDLGFNRGHAQYWFDGCPVAGAGAAAFAYFSLHYSLHERGSQQGHHWYSMERDAPVLWFDLLHNQGLVFRGVGLVDEVRTVRGTRLEGPDRVPRAVLFTHIKIRMYTGASRVLPGWLNALNAAHGETDPSSSLPLLAGVIEPTGWSAWTQRYFAAHPANKRRYVFGDTVRGMQPENSQANEELNLPEEHRRGRTSTAAVRSHKADILQYEDYVGMLQAIQRERGSFNGAPVGGALPDGGIVLPTLAPELLPADL